MKKKGIVLLITLFFISAISILILKNLEDSETFLNSISYDSKLNQLKITHRNIIKQVMKLVNENKDNIDIILEKAQSIPLSFNGINLVINLEILDSQGCNINDIKTVEDIEKKCTQDVSYNILDPYKFVGDLRKIVTDKNSKKIESKKQFDYFIDSYSKSVDDKKVLTIKDQFSYFSTKVDTTYLQCDYDIFLQDEVSGHGTFVFKLGSSKEERSFFILN